MEHMTVYSILGFVAKLGVIEAEMHTVNHAIVARACELICAEAKRVIGTYDYGWPQLSPKTLEHKFFNTPLLETNAMRASIEWHAEGNSGEVGSNSDIAVFQELGTSRIPPRPFLAGATQHREDKIHKMAARAVVACIAGRGLHST